MTPALVLIRGEPGAGKSTLARKMIADRLVDRHLEADMWMVDASGQYRFTPEMLPFVHQKCLDATSDALAAGLRVVVANCFTAAWQIRPYLDLDPAAKIVRATGFFVSLHGVSAAKSNEIRRSMEPIDGEEILP